MCLYATTGRLIATDDLTVYKVMRVTKRPWWLAWLGDKLTSPFQHKRYWRLFTVRSILDKPLKEGTVDRGLHAYRSQLAGKSRIHDTSQFYGEPFQLYKAVILKGSHYYLGNNGDIVADCMTIL